MELIHHLLSNKPGNLIHPDSFPAQVKAGFNLPQAHQVIHQAGRIRIGRMTGSLQTPSALQALTEKV